MVEGTAGIVSSEVYPRLILDLSVPDPSSSSLILVKNKLPGAGAVGIARTKNQRSRYLRTLLPLRRSCSKFSGKQQTPSIFAQSLFPKGHGPGIAHACPAPRRPHPALRPLRQPAFPQPRVAYGVTVGRGGGGRGRGGSAAAGCVGREG
ncbi:hypothetical protein TREES_T100016748 [Tupaia chinensis]|uniref:Uncharacterized protein n=1 Tax=Tupaia chinensis TaxID=246437 RepID=L9L2Q0_TUPCH|nr:hypothetical protein TREES_T100016748 [Tupaia chinensis]